MYINRAKEHLGLTVSKTTTDSTLLVFTKVDKRQGHQNRQFLLELSLEGDDGKTYKVLKCEPTVDYAQMEKTLNETNDFSGFVTTLRSKFQQLALTE